MNSPLTEQNIEQSSSAGGGGSCGVCVGGWGVEDSRSFIYRLRESQTQTHPYLEGRFDTSSHTLNHGPDVNGTCHLLWK